MRQETSEFKWSGKSSEAAQLLAEGSLTHADIAAKVGVSRQTVSRWLQNHEFAACVDSIIDDYRKAVRRRGLAVLERRVDALNDRWVRMRKVIDDRAADPDMAEVPGGTTGLLVKDYKTVGSGESAVVRTIYSVDTGLLKEIREHEKQAAQELGQWVEKGSQEVSGPNGAAVAFEAAIVKVYGAVDAK